jgi:hypothetical protein
LGIKPIIDKTPTDLPEPLSPTMAIDSPSWRVYEMPLTA